MADCDEWWTLAFQNESWVRMSLKIRWISDLQKIVGIRQHSDSDLNSITAMSLRSYHTTTTVLRPFFRDHPGEPVPEENFWTLWYKGRLTEADTLIIRLGATPSRLISDPPPSSLHFYAGCPNQCPPPPSPSFLRARCPSCRPTNSVKASLCYTM